MRLVPHLCVLSLLGAAALPAAERVMEVRDLRLSIGTTPGLDTVEQQVSGSGTVQATGSSDDGMTVSLGYHHSNIYRGGGYFWSIGGQLIELEVTGADFTFYGVTTQMGYAYAFTPQAHLEVGPFVTVGYSNAEFSAASGDTSAAIFAAYGLRVGGFYEWNHLVAGLQLEYSSIAATYQDINVSTSSATVTQVAVAGDGIAGQVSVGIRF